MPDSDAPRSEWELIDWIRSRTAVPPTVSVGPGDDTALVLPLTQPARGTLITTDMLLDGVHFDLASTSPRAIGHKSMNVNISDIAAMAGQPTAAVVAVALPTGQPADFPKELFAGLQEAAAAFGVTIVGGDTNAGGQRLVIAVTLLGEPSAKGPVLRSGAKAGDVLMVTGPLGYSLPLGTHFTFRPRVAEALRLHELCDIHAMIDISDGLASDARHIAERSNVGMEIDRDLIPIRSVDDTIGDGQPGWQHALSDGEDFELLFAVAPADGDRLLADQPLRDLGVTLTAVGRCIAEPGLWLRSDGNRQPLSPTGYTHRWG